MAQPPISPSDSVTAELRRGWRPLLGATIGVGLGLSPIPPYTSGLFADALTKEFGWTRGAILMPLSFLTLSLLLTGPWLGRLVDRHGARFVALPATLGLGLSIALMALVTQAIWTFYACWALLAAVSIGTLPITYAHVITRHFDKARGLALGLCLASTGLTGALAQPYLHWLITAHGWRVAYLGLAAVPLFVALPLIAWLLDPKGEPTAAARHAETAPAPGMTRAEAMRDRRFFAMGLAGLALGAATGGLIPNLVPVLVDRGIPTAVTLAAMGMLALSVVAGRLLSGALLDRLPGPVVGTLMVLPAFAALAVLRLGTGAPAPESLAMASAIGVGLIAGAEFDLVAYMTGRYFGRGHFSAIYALLYAIFGIGSGVAPGLLGALHDASKGPGMLLDVTLGLLAIAVAAMLTLGRYPAEYSGEA